MVVSVNGIRRSRVKKGVNGRLGVMVAGETCGAADVGGSVKITMG